MVVGSANIDVVFVTWLECHWTGDQALANYRTERINCDFVSHAESAASGVASIMVDDTA